MTKTKARSTATAARDAPDTAQNAAKGLEGLNTDLFNPPAWMRDKIASQLPQWAPIGLVNELVLYKMTQTQAGSFARSIFEYPDDEQAMLERILTRPGMNIVWQSIKTACTRERKDFDRFVRDIWRQLATAHAVMKQASKTPSEEREELKEIVDSLHLAMRKIERNRVAKILNSRAIHELTAKQLARDLPSSDHPLHDQVIMEAQINSDVIDTLGEELYDRKARRETRLAEALAASVGLSLTDVSGHLIGEIERFVAGYKGEVKNLGNPAPVFIRRVRGLFKDYFNQPMASIVAALLNVALDRDLGDITEELVRKTR